MIINEPGGIVNTILDDLWCVGY